MLESVKYRYCTLSKYNLLVVVFLSFASLVFSVIFINIGRVIYAFTDPEGWVLVYANISIAYGCALIVLQIWSWFRVRQTSLLFMKSFGMAYILASGSAAGVLETVNISEAVLFMALITAGVFTQYYALNVLPELNTASS